MKSLIILLLFISCSWQQAKNPFPAEMISLIEPQWFKLNPQHALMDKYGRAQLHLFFDVDPELSSKKQTLNIVVHTPEGASYANDLDLHSGQTHFSHSYCKQKDIWESEPGMINRPPYSIGFVPRVLDQLGRPQKIILFGNSQNLARTMNYSSFQARPVGAFVEQICPEANCLGKGNWRSRLVLVAIDPHDPKFQKVTSKDELLKLIDWKYVKASLENLDGHNSIGDDLYPSKKVGQLIPIKEAFAHFIKHSLPMTDKSTKKIQNSCQALYDQLWDQVGKSKADGFARRFQQFTKKYYSEMNTCDKFVYRGNVNLDPEKFWFLNFVGIFYRLHQDGFLFDCENHSWRRNILNRAGEPIHVLKRDISQCDEKDIDQAMYYLPNFLNGLKATSSSYYKLIDYDNRSHGTHKKLYSWVNMPAKKFSCSDEINEKVLKNTEVFPEDVKWEPRYRKVIKE